MRRALVVLIVLVLALSTLVWLRLRSQSRALHAASSGTGEIEGVTVDLSSRLMARVERVLVAEGAAVKKNDLLLVLDCSDSRASLAEAEARLATAQAQARAASVTIGAARSSQQAAVAARAVAEAQAASLAAQRDAAARQAQRLQALQADVAAASRDQTQASAEQLKHQVQAMEAQAAANLEQMRAAGASARASTAQADAAQSSVRAVEAAVARARLMVIECEVRAPRDAYVSELPREAGELVLPGAVLVRLLDLSQVKATFYLPNAELAAARAGAPVTVVADAYPGERFSGRVTTVGLQAEFTPRNIQTRTDRDRLVYAIEVLVDNPDGKLKAGMPVEVTLPGSERP